MIKKSYALLFLLYCADGFAGNEKLYTFKLAQDNNRIVAMHERYVVYFKAFWHLIHDNSINSIDKRHYTLSCGKLSTLQTFKRCINYLELTDIYNNPAYTRRVIKDYLREESDGLIKNQNATFSSYLTERLHMADYLNFELLFSVCLHLLKKEMLKLRGATGYSTALNLNLASTLSWKVAQKMMNVENHRAPLVLYSKLQLREQFKFYIEPRFIQLSSDGRTAVIGGKTVVVIWNFDDARISRCYFSKKPLVATLVSPDGSLLAVATDSSIKIYDIKLGEIITKIKTEMAIKSLAFYLDNKSIICGSQDGILKIFSTAGDQEMSYFTGHTTGISFIGVLPEGKIVTCSNDQTVRIWDCDMQDFDTIECFYPIEYAALCTTGQKLFISGRTKDNKMRSSYINLATRMIYDLGLGFAKPVSITGIRFARLTPKSTQISRIDTPESYILDTIKPKGYYSIAFSHDGYRAITCSGKTIKFWQNCTHDEVESILKEVSVPELVLLRTIIQQRMQSCACSSKDYEGKLPDAMIKNLLQWGILTRYHNKKQKK